MIAIHSPCRSTRNVLHLFALSVAVAGGLCAHAQTTCSPNIAPGTSFGAQYAGGPFTFASGAAVFADAVLGYNNLGAPMLPSFADPCAAVGIPDYSPNPGSSHSAQNASGATSLGEGGQIELGFIDNILTNSATSAADLFVFQGGNNAEQFFVHVRPGDPATLSAVQLAGFSLNAGFAVLPSVFGSSFATTIDLDGFLPAFPPGALRFDAVRIIDDPGQQFPTPYNPGLDLDSVAAIDASTPPPTARALRVANTSATSVGYINVPGSVSISPQQLTVEASITPLGFGFGNTNDVYGAHFITRANDAIASGLFGGSWSLRWSPMTQRFNVALNYAAGQGVNVFAMTPIPVGVTAHVALTYDGQRIRLYVNGSLEADMAWVHSIYYDQAANLRFGAANGPGGYVRRFDGVVDAVRIWSYARSGCEIAAAMDCEVTGPIPGLVGSWNFSTADGSDVSGNGNDGAPVGSEVTYVAEPVLLGRCSSGGAYVVYGTAKVNSAGCVPRISCQGVASASGAPAFAVTASDVLSNKTGILFYGFAPASVQFQGGTLLVAAPVSRTPAQFSGGNPPPDNCSGTYSYDMGARIQSGVDAGLVPGAVVYCQYWSRDPSSPSSTGLTDALVFTVCQ